MLEEKSLDLPAKGKAATELTFKPEETGLIELEARLLPPEGLSVSNQKKIQVRIRIKVKSLEGSKPADLKSGKDKKSADQISLLVKLPKKVKAGRKLSLKVKVSHKGQKAPTQVKVELLVDGKVVAIKSIRPRTGGAAYLTMQYIPSQAGNQVWLVRLDQGQAKLLEKCEGVEITGKVIVE